MGLIEMSVKTPSEKFLMTVPKPIHDWLSNEAEKLGVTIQDRIRVMLEEEVKRRINFTDAEVEAVKQECYLIGKKTYDEFAIERKRLTILQMPEDYKSEKYKAFFLEHDIPIDFTLPVIQKSFQPILRGESDSKLHEYDINKAAKQVAELENKLLSVCEDGDKLFEMMSFGCRIYVKDGEWTGCFRICLNSERTPTFADAIKVTS